ncbi:hypothetical protein H8L32_03160 [Undibacterium sp. CY18W]|uniref:Uncharacterized protein n=1 Tax=Undibacterium hunanense TaxID=2762292 RepID=A0ABR6ZKR2_9BURK|nr:hypothetical protein [Undibacterium hunanense]MBC3916474.1 hypothetical protein [Undibacterium hunanense]
MNVNERAWLCEEIQKYKSHQEIVSLASDLDYRFSARGLFSLSRIKLEFQKFVDMNCYLDMLLFRAKAAVAVCRLPTLVFKENTIRNDGIEGCTYAIESELLNMFAKNRTLSTDRGF